MVKVKKECVLIKPEDLKPSSPELEILGVFNPAAIRLKNKDIVLYVRVWEKLIKAKDEHFFYSPRMIGTDKFKVAIDKFEKKSVISSSDFDFLFKDGTKRLTFISHLRRVILDKTGFNVKYIHEKPSFFGIASDGELGIEDPRITKINNIYFMTYVSLSRTGNLSTSYAISNDCIKWHRKGIMFGEQNKDVVLFPEVVKGQYIAIERPEGSFQFTPPHMWITYSNDMESWGREHPLIISKKGEWDSGRVGAGCPPIKTKKGWLLIYHGVLTSKRKKIIDAIMDKMELSECLSGTIKEKDTIYCAGAALLDLEDPLKLIAKSEVPILFPIKKHEIASFDSLRVIFPTGIIIDENKKDLLIYCGAGDKVTSVKKISLNKIFKKLKMLDNNF